jgi:hypothetical protein
VLLFDVFGRVLGVEPAPAGGWRLVEIGSEGKHRAMSEVVIPSFLGADELGRYLADVFHEQASPAHPDVRRLR